MRFVILHDEVDPSKDAQKQIVYRFSDVTRLCQEASMLLFVRISCIEVGLSDELGPQASVLFNQTSVKYDVLYLLPTRREPFTSAAHIKQGY